MRNERVDEARDNAERAVGQAADTAKAEAPKVVAEAKERARVAASTASRALEEAAGKVRESGPRLPGGERTTRLAEGAAGAMETAADKTREKAEPGVKGRIGRIVKNNPVSVAVAALVVAITGVFIKKKMASDEPGPEHDDEEVTA